MDFVDRFVDLNSPQGDAQQAIQDALDVEATVGSRGYAIVLDILEEIKLDAENLLLDQIPGEPEKILAYHAAAFAVRKSFQTLLEAIQDIRNKRLDAENYLNALQEPEVENYFT